MISTTADEFYNMTFCATLFQYYWFLFMTNIEKSCLDMEEEMFDIEGDEQDQTEMLSNKTSKWWAYFESIFENGFIFAVCKYCEDRP